MGRDKAYTFVAALLRRSKNRTAANLDHYAKRSLGTATPLQKELSSPDLDVKLWTDRMIFTPGSTNIEALEGELGSRRLC